MLITIHLAQGQLPVGTGNALSADNLGQVACSKDPLHLQELGGSFSSAHALIAPIPVVLQGERCKLGGVVNLVP